jgi:hypothetical protein
MAFEKHDLHAVGERDGFDLGELDFAKRGELQAEGGIGRSDLGLGNGRLNACPT